TAAIAPLALKYLPLVVIVTALRLIALCARQQDGETASRLSALLILCIGAAASIAYFPDYVHIALVGGVFFVATAEAAEWALRVLPARVGPPLGWAVASLLALAGAAQLHGLMARLQSQYNLHYDTAFGRVDSNSRWEVELYRELDERLRGRTPRLLYCYRNCS